MKSFDLMHIFNLKLFKEDLLDVDFLSSNTELNLIIFFGFSFKFINFIKPIEDRILSLISGEVFSLFLIIYFVYDK